jgi:hypothetical protein
VNHELEAALAAAVNVPALWDEGVEAARNACVAGAPLAAGAITAAAFYDNPLTGGRALRMFMHRLFAAPLALETWRTLLAPAPHPETGDAGFVPGFGHVGARAESAVLSACRSLHSIGRGQRLGFYLEHARALRESLGALNVTGMCGLLFLDALLDDDEAERRFLLLRLEPALQAAQRARKAGLGRFPFFENGYAYEGAWPSTRMTEPCSDLELSVLKKAVGLE